MIVGAFGASAAVLLVVAGLAKLRTPQPAAAMIAMLWPRVRSGRRLTRCAGLVELIAGLTSLGLGSRAALGLLAACYLVLTAVALRLATGRQPATCGCFGAADGVVGPAHIALDVAGSAAAIAAAVRPPGAVWNLFGSGALTGVTVTAQALLLAALGYLSITALPALAAARRQAEGRS